MRGAKSRSVTSKSRRDARAADGTDTANEVGPDAEPAGPGNQRDPDQSGSRRGGRATKAAKATKTSKAAKATKADLAERLPNRPRPPRRPRR